MHTRQIRIQISTLTSAKIHQSITLKSWMNSWYKAQIPDCTKIDMATFMCCMKISDSSLPLGQIVPSSNHIDICFCIAYIFFTIISFTIVFTAATQIQNTVLNVINIVYSIMQNLSYLMVALSNPGVETSDTLPTE